MPTSAVIARWCCGVLTLWLGLLILKQQRHPAGRLVVKLWLFALAGFGAAFIPLARRLNHSNLGHYYIGAKYRIPYFDFYRVVTAALGQPQMGYRDLAKPHRFVRRDPLEQRYYALTLLRERGIDIPDQASTEDLLQLCSTSGLFGAEAERILASFLSPEARLTLREDLRRVRVDTDDNGFNGSPVYVLFRQADPTLRHTFNFMVGWLNLFWQFGALLLALHAVAVALDWDAETRALAAAVFFCSWDFNGWALNGLSFGGWLLPTALALYGMRRRCPWLTGFAIAWAGLIKLFPFVLLAPLGSTWLRAMTAWLRGDRDTPVKDALRFTTIALGSTVAGACVLFAVAAHITGMSWLGFIQKIHGQFERSILTVNTVSLAQILLALSVDTARIALIPVLLYAWTLVVMSWGTPLRTLPDELSRAAALSLALLGWVLGNWFNYYALVCLFLLADLFRRQPYGVAAALLVWGVTMLLPEYDQCYLRNLRLLGILKALPFLVIPVWALSSHLKKILTSGSHARPGAWFSVSRLVYGAGFVLIVATICANVYTAHSARASLSHGRLLAEQQRFAEAEMALRHARRYDPRSAVVAMHLADVLDQLGRQGEAAAQYRAAVALDPQTARAWMMLGLYAAQRGQNAEALRLLGRAVQTAPHDPLVRYNHAIALQSTGQTREAITEAQWAVWLAPAFSPARSLLNEIQRVSPPGDA